MPKKATDIALNPYPNILLIGDSGSHKTFFTGTAPQPYNFDFDRGMAILRNNPTSEYDSFSDASWGTKVTPKMEAEGIFTWGTAWEKFLTQANKIGADMDKGVCPYRTLCLDSFTTLSDLCMNYVLRMDNKMPGNIQIQHWGSQIQLLQKVISDFTSWPIIFITTAHIQRNQNDLTQVIEMLPLVTGKLAGKLGLYFDEVYYMQSKKNAAGVTEFTLKTESDTMYKQAKTRYGVPNNSPATWQAIEPYLLGTT